MNLINKLKKPLKSLAIGIGLSLITIPAYTQNRSIEFYEGTFESAKNEAKKIEKMIFIDSYTKWCRPCKEMDKEVFTNNSVADFYNQKFINMKMDMETKEGNKILLAYNVNMFPTFLFLDDKGKLLHKGAGGMKSPEFISLGEEALNPETQLATFNEKYKKGKRDSEFIYNYLTILKNAAIDYNDIFEDYFKTQKEEDLTSKKNLDILFINKWGTNINSKPFNYLIKNKEKFDIIYNSDSLNNKIFEAYYHDFSKTLDEKSFNDSIYDEWKSKAKNQNFSHVNEVLLEADLQYNEKIKNWNAYASNAVLLINKYQRNYSAKKLNILAWTVFKNIKDENLLEKALGWAKHSVELDSMSSNNGTYASLLYVLGDTAKAIKIEQRAIKLAKETKSSEKYLKTLNENLQKMKAGEKLD